MEKYGFIYIWRDRGKNRYYIGAHWGREDDGYICSSSWMRNSLNRRPQDFRRKILSRHSTIEETFNKEYEWLKLISEEELGKRYYNHVIFRYKLKSERIVSENYRERMRGENNPFYGKHHSEETIKIIKEKRAFQITSEQTRMKMSEARLGNKYNLGKHRTKEQKENMSQKMTGRIFSEEHKRKLSEAAKNRKIRGIND